MSTKSQRVPDAPSQLPKKICVNIRLQASEPDLPTQKNLRKHAFTKPRNRTCQRKKKICVNTRLQSLTKPYKALRTENSNTTNQARKHALSGTSDQSKRTPKDLRKHAFTRPVRRTQFEQPTSQSMQNQQSQSAEPPL